MIDLFQYLVGGLAIGLLLYEFMFNQGELFGPPYDEPTDCADEDTPIVDPNDRLDF